MGAQTVFPGSTHESGELIAWGESSPIARRGRGSETTMCACCGRRPDRRTFPVEGCPSRCRTTLGGFLFRCGFSRPDAELFVEAVTIASGQSREKVRDVRKAAGEAWDEANRPRGKAGVHSSHRDLQRRRREVCCQVARLQSSDADRRALESEPFYNGRVLSDARDGPLPLFPLRPDAEPYPAGALV
jgi:hypothetical protein